MACSRFEKVARVKRVRARVGGVVGVVKAVEKAAAKERLCNQLPLVGL